MSAPSSATELSLLQTIDCMDEKELDALPYGAIQLDVQGTVLKYNAYEERLAGMTRQSVVGKNFFKDVAPCTDVKGFYGRFKEGASAGKLHCKFRYRFAFRQRPRDVTVTLFYSDRNRSVWVFIQPLEANA